MELLRSVEIIEKKEGKKNVGERRNYGPTNWMLARLKENLIPPPAPTAAKRNDNDGPPTHLGAEVAVVRTGPYPGRPTYSGKSRVRVAFCWLVLSSLNKCGRKYGVFKEE